MNHWFSTARFGMFVHWGHSSQQGIELSWPLVGGVFSLPFCGNMPIEQYHATALHFNPQHYNPAAWAQLAKRLGMQYVILTAKHHDGFALFHTQQSTFSIQHTPYEQDIVRQFVEAMRDAGLHVGLYFSLIDWHHPDYPAFTEADKPYRFGQYRQPTPEQWERFITFMFAQVQELLTNYGPIDILWFDGGWERTPEQWRVQKLYELIRSLQPEILINDRLPGFGDFATPEQFIPPQPLAGAWETCMTINESWGYNAEDTHFKSPRQLIHTLCEVASKGGNLLLNISPMGNGEVQPELMERLTAIADWMAVNQESIVGTEPGLEPWQFYGPSTRRKQRLYLHLLMKPYDTITVRGIPIQQVKGIQVLATGKALRYSTRCAISESILNPNPLGELTIEVPEAVLDPYATILAVDMRESGLS
ncbi:alpha-L-fucosidase [Trichocoleus sp. FACHB-262]|uniref:alpha-L-fucosidase n=1 Tax=Trichocoleus sp. FACHB-262 TaxID=2692869 RepID=UPI001685BBD0|nr:alpha-L-fucosidase [Trichocoleus sp. FACHB-262]MBD2120986.1 alpha-L-fucosidase [Trichocoleus sp. FACHB-262]